MGMDLVEITMRCEDEFGIEISDEDWAGPEMRRIEGLYWLILRKLNLGCAHFCLSSRVFYRLRGAMMGTLAIPRQAIRPATLTKSLLPDGDLRPVWVALSERMGWHPARLERPQPLEVLRKTPAVLVACLLVGLVALVGCQWGAGRAVTSGLAAAVPAIVLVAAVHHYVGLWTAGWRRRLPRDCATIGDLVRATIRCNYTEIRTAEERFAVTREEVWQHLQHLIAEELGMPMHKIAHDKRWAEDLRAD